ncbi:leucine-rich repeat-containing protein 49-like isoform X2 [Lineus longissimus]|uniref:leucine-rich repeat-containing protein 49-like isoform X2 n=1 Tax=Lineus longissimus TaxID=88925 RepID=UPI002B4CC970
MSMYHYSKARNITRQTVTPKEGSADGRRDSTGGLLSNELIGNHHMLRRYTSPNDLHITPAAPDKSTNQKSNSYVKRQVVPATAHAHDFMENGDDSSARHTRSAQMSPRGNNKAPAFLPGDRVIFAESPSAPGIPIVYRTAEERNSNPDRLNLDRRRLTVCPILEGEDQLRLLNYQHNFITRIQHLNGIKRLIFLDLYDNQIEEISGLNTLKSLRVLMLGKNRIKKIENLTTLMKLDVLDLHGNQIKEIRNLSHLTELRVLNLAGNEIQHVDNLTGMDSLAELNLRRNKIRTISDIDSLASLQRLFLSFNEITCWEDICCLGDSSSLSEISLDGNPFAQDQYYKQVLLRHMSQLRQLDMKRITEEERRIAIVMARKEDEKKRETNKAAVIKEKRRIAINNAKRQWEVNTTHLMSRTNNLVKMPEIYANHVATVSNSTLERMDNDDIDSLSSGRHSRPTSAHSLQSQSEAIPSSNRPRSARHQVRPDDSKMEKEPIILSNMASSPSGSNLTHLAELDNDTLNLYGSGSLEALDRNWGIQAAGAVTTVAFKFIDFEIIAKQLHKIRARFPSVTTLIFSATNIHNLHQINALASMRRLDNIFIELDGNPVTQFSLWKTYLLYRLAHFALKKINNVDITLTDISNAEKIFGPLGHITTSQLTQSRLLSLLGETRRKQFLAQGSDVRKSPDVKLGNTEAVNRAGLVYVPSETLKQKSQELKMKNDFSKLYIAELKSEAIHVDSKRIELQKVWPQIFVELVQNAVIDMYDGTSYMKKCMEDLEKT